MSSVSVFENWTPVHETMRPVKQCVVRDKADQKADWNVVKRVLERIPLDSRQSGFVELEQTGAHD